MFLVYQPTSLDGPFNVDPPIIRSAGLPAALEEAAGEASFDGGFSVMIEALIQATSSWERKSSCSSRKVYSGGLPRDGLDAAMAPSRTSGTHGHQCNVLYASS